MQKQFDFDSAETYTHNFHKDVFYGNRYDNVYDYESLEEVHRAVIRFCKLIGFRGEHVVNIYIHYDHLTYNILGEEDERADFSFLQWDIDEQTDRECMEYLCELVRYKITKYIKYV